MKPFLFAVALSVLGTAPVAARDHAVPFKPVTGAFFALSVANHAESVAWYREKLGLDVTFETHEGADVAVLEGGGLIVELVKVAGARPGPAEAVQNFGLFKSGFVVKDFDAAVEALRARGVAFAYGPFPKNGAQRANVILRDNAGNLLQMFGD